MKPYPILDVSGKTREWLQAGRGLVVWQSHDIGAGRPDQFTPADHVDSCQGCEALTVKPILPGESLTIETTAPAWLSCITSRAFFGCPRPGTEASVAEVVLGWL